MVGLLRNADAQQTYDMIKNYLKIILRTLKKNKLLAMLNILGLALSISSFLLIIVYINYETEFDSFHENASRIYRISTKVKTDASEDHISWAHGFLGGALKEQYEEVENAVRFSTLENNFLVNHDDRPFKESEFCYAESTILQVFTYPMLYGNPEKALIEPNSIVLTEGIAHKYFGQLDSAIGEVLQVNGENYEVTGIIENLPGNSDFNFTGLLSVDQRKIDEIEWAFTYILMKEDSDISLFFEKLQRFTQEQVQPHFDRIGAKVEYELEPLLGLHLSKPKLFDTPKSNPVYITILFVVAILILIMAIVNYVNLSIASSIKRSLELGARKVFGASKRSGIIQFMFESLLICSLSIVISIILVILVLPFFNQKLGVEIKSIDLFALSNMAWIVLAIIFLIIVSASYYSFYLVSLSPLELLSGHSSTKRSNLIRKLMVAIQFTTTMAMVVCSLLIYNQLKFVFNSELGFDKDQVLVINLFNDGTIDERKNSLKADLLSNPDIVAVGFSSSNSIPGNDMDKVSFTVETVDGENTKIFSIVKAGPGYLEAMGLTLAEGRDFANGINPNSTVKFLVNETLVKSMGWQDPVGLEIESDAFGKGQIAGVVKDFNFKSFYQKIEPIIIIFDWKSAENMIVKFDVSSAEETLNTIQLRWQTYMPDRPFDFYFLEESFFNQYKKDIVMKDIFLYFTVFTVFVAALGLFGLSFFTGKIRLKEVSIRKILGASSGNIIKILFKDYIYIFLLSMVLAIPISIYVIGLWLEGFAYKSDLKYSTFIIAALLAVGIIIVTTGYHIIKVMKERPVDVLRNE